MNANRDSYPPINWETIRANGRGMDEKALRKRFDSCKDEPSRRALLREIVTARRDAGRAPMSKVIDRSPNTL
jgi:hypothetical protein